MAHTHLDPARNVEERTTPDPTGPESDRAKTDAKPVLTVPEAADMLGISRSLAYELVARREIPAYRLGRRILVPQRAVENILASAFAARTGWTG